jgi:cytoskeletal protein CcmA (bactofilin family)
MIGRHVVITGDITSDGHDLVIEGVVEGFVSANEASVTVETDARVEGDIRAGRVLVRGTVHGAISATERIEVASTACVDGSLSAGRIFLADGAYFRGWIDMGRKTIAAIVAAYREQQARRAGSG